MAEGDGSAVDVDAAVVEVHQLHVCEGDDGEGLIDLVVIDVGEGDSGVSEGAGHGEGGGRGEILGGLLSVAEAEHTGDGGEAEGGGVLLAGEPRTKSEERRGVLV